MADFVDDEGSDDMSYEYNSEELEDEDAPYEYTDYGDTPALGREISDSHVHVPDGYCNFVNYREILPIMEKLIRETSALTGQSEDTAQLLLQCYRWSFEFVAERYFADTNLALQNAGVTSAESADSSNDMCLICYDAVGEGDMVGLSCGHRFCR
jgi:hypothetical protein